MKKLLCLSSFVLSLSMLCMVGCEDDADPDDITFRNNSSREVKVRVRNTVSNTDYTFTLEPNGGVEKYMKALIDPLSYTYTPTATVTDRRSGDTVFFEDILIE
ncbi:MAG: hypothetical protein EOM12_08855 [Verrucomicrobiae bacterium]|nr:hypothetical protein [Verrucomicrobiae bacterium]